MSNILVTGSQGLVGSYVCFDLLSHGYKVTGIDDYSKCGKIIRLHDDHPNFIFVKEDVVKINKIFKGKNFDYIINLAALVGGVSYLNQHAYDILVTNERINASIFDYAIHQYKQNNLKRIIQISSSMVYENTISYPTSEDDLISCIPPSSTYGFQKLASEYFCKGAYEQYGLPYTIIRLFNCVGEGEIGHVISDLIEKILILGPDKPCHIFGSGKQIRSYTNGKDVARGIRLAMESEEAICEVFNISTSVSTSVIDLVSIIYKILYNCKPPELIRENLFFYDVQKSIPDTSKAERILNFKSKISLEDSITEICNWIKNISDNKRE